MCPSLTCDAVWIDVFSPTPEEEQQLEAALGTDIPTREEMQAIELSSRLYEENGILFLTATVADEVRHGQPESSAITFILTSEKLVTLRYADPAPFAAFRARREANVHRYTDRRSRSRRTNRRDRRTDRGHPRRGGREPGRPLDPSFRPTDCDVDSPVCTTRSAAHRTAERAKRGNAISSRF